MSELEGRRCRLAADEDLQVRGRIPFLIVLGWVFGLFWFVFGKCCPARLRMPDQQDAFCSLANLPI